MAITLLTGKVELLRDAVRVVAPDDTAAPTDVPYTDLSSVWLDQATLVLERRSGETIRIRSHAELDILFALAQRMARALHPGGSQRSFAIVLPLKPGRSGQARELAEHGPPFDPEAAGLRRHQVFVTESEAVFVFESRANALGDMLAAPETLTAAAAWREIVGGLARIAEQVYAWETASKLDPEGGAT